MMRRIMLSIVLSTLMSISFAGITIDGTRIIFPSNAKSINVQLRNTFSTPALAQVWIDNGNVKEIPKGDEIPFILTPSLTRIEAKKGQIIRIIPTNTSTLPQDRESLFWFNLLDIPPENKQIDTINKIDFTVRTRIKIFYRPSKLKMQPIKAYENLIINKINSNEIEITNPSPYYITLVKVQNLNMNKNIIKDSEILKPYEKTLIKTTDHIESSQLTYTIINDLGTPQEFSSKYPTYK